MQIKMGKVPEKIVCIVEPSVIVRSPHEFSRVVVKRGAVNTCCKKNKKAADVDNSVIHIKISIIIYAIGSGNREPAALSATAVYYSRKTETDYQSREV
jgi:hypothetical protein